MDYKDIDFDDLDGEQLDVARIIGIENYRKLSSIYCGAFIYISKPETSLIKKRNKKIYLDFLNGKKVKLLSGKYNLSESTIRVIVNEERKKEA